MKQTMQDGEPLIGGKTIAQWDKEWVDVPGGFVVPHPEFIGKAGLYRAIENGETVVIGKAAGAWECRLSKRLADFRRPGRSGRTHRTGDFIHKNLDTLQLQVLVIGSDSEACSIANKLVRPMIARHKPRENVPFWIIRQVAYSG